MPQFSYCTHENAKKVMIEIGSGSLKRITEYLHHTKIGLIIDENVNHLHQNSIRKAFSEFSVETIIFTSNEKNKSFATVQSITETLLSSGFGRDSLLIGIGGGILTDVCGFSAAVLNRGIPYLNIPTTLLGMVDASIGGKTGVNTKTGKNLIGAIKQPEAIIIDTDFLKTLPKKIFLEGIAESLKMGFAIDALFLNFMKINKEKILSRDRKTLLKLIEKSVRLKSQIVEKDALEGNLRQILNFGHTFAHAFEKLSDFKLTHGEAVSIGIMSECYLSYFEGNTTEKLTEEIKKTLTSFGLPVSLPLMIQQEAVLEAMRTDKKSIGGSPRFIMLKDSGEIKSENNQYSFEAKQENIIKALNAVSK